MIFFFSGHGIALGDQTHILPELQGSKMRNATEVGAAAVNVQALTGYASDNATASVVILAAHVPEYTPAAARWDWRDPAPPPNPSLAIPRRPP